MISVGNGLIALQHPDASDGRLPRHRVAHGQAGYPVVACWGNRNINFPPGSSQRNPDC